MSGPAARSDALVSRLSISAAIRDAIETGQPVVALESTLISHGLPYPDNLDVARLAERAIREAGALPATIAIRDGRFRVGLDDATLESLARAPAGTVGKVSRANLAVALAKPGWHATTVSATMIAAHAAGIRVFATGGIGGVHRGAFGGADPSLDVSADLEELARTPVAVVCAGPKAILNVRATLEVLETRGVPVIALGQDDVPGFYARSSGIRAPATASDADAAAAILAVHFALGLGGGALVCVPLPEATALTQELARSVVERAVEEAETAGIAGPELTPWLLDRVSELTDGASVRANAALIVNNARTGGWLAVRLAQLAAAEV